VWGEKQGKGKGEGGEKGKERRLSRVFREQVLLSARKFGASAGGENSRKKKITGQTRGGQHRHTNFNNGLSMLCHIPIDAGGKQELGGGKKGGDKRTGKINGRNKKWLLGSVASISSASGRLPGQKTKKKERGRRRGTEGGKRLRGKQEKFSKDRGKGLRTTYRTAAGPKKFGGKQSNGKILGGRGGT